MKAAAKATPSKATPAKSKAAKKVDTEPAPLAKSAESDDSDSDSDDEKPAVAAPAKVAVEAKSDSDDSSDSEDEAKPAAVVAKQAESSSGSDDSDDDEDVEMAAPDAAAKGMCARLATFYCLPSWAANGKRKADDAAIAAPKKQKLENGEASPAGETNGIFVGGLSWNVDNDQLQQFFSECGEITSARVQMDRQTGKSRGFGYVDFSAGEAVEAALAMNGSEFDGRTIKVDRSVNKFDPKVAMEKRQRDFGNTPNEPSATLFVGNLSWSTTEDGLWEIFGEHGEVKSVRMPTDRETGKPKGFGYVEFTDLDAAKKAYDALQGQEIEGRGVRLDYSQPRDNSGGGRGGFGGGGRGGGRGGFGGDRGGRGGFGGDRGGRGGGRGGFGGGRGRGGGDSGWVCSSLRMLFHGSTLTLLSRAVAVAVVAEAVAVVPRVEAVPAPEASATLRAKRRRSTEHHCQRSRMAAYHLHSCSMFSLSCIMLS